MAGPKVRNIAAIDVGSNAMRLVIATVGEDNQPRTIASIREPVRLGHDVFTKGIVSGETLERTLQAFRRFRTQMRSHRVESFRAVATSAMREARNREMVRSRIQQVTGIELNVIPAEEEARLVYLAVANRVPLQGHRALLVDIGGGSVEIVLAEDGQIAATDSFRMGAVRLLQELGDAKAGTRRFNKLVREYVESTRKRLRKKIGSKKIDLCLATGGNVESLGDLRHQLLGKSDGLLKADELGKLITKLQKLTVEERIEKLELRPDRADVIVPSAIVLHRILQWIGAGEVVFPHVGLKDGLLIDLLARLDQQRTDEFRSQVLTSARQLGAKYGFDKDHADSVSRFAIQLFDATQKLHDLNEDHRLLLEVSAQLHEIGNYVDVTGHHKHSYYLLINSPLLGLADWQRAIVANVARYHRKAPPSLNHEPYRNLPPKSRLIVTKLAALLRVADALDSEHGAKVKKAEFECRPPKLLLRVRGRGDLLLERWAMERKSEMFEEVFGLKVALSDSV